MKINYFLLGEKIKKIRRMKNLSQNNLAELVNVSLSYISRIECGKNHISLDLLVNVCEALETTVSEIMTGNQENFEGDYYNEFLYLMKGCTNFEKRLIIEVCNVIKETIRKENTK